MIDLALDGRVMIRNIMDEAVQELDILFNTDTTELLGYPTYGTNFEQFLWKGSSVKCRHRQLLIMIHSMLRDGEYKPGRRYHDIESGGTGIDRFMCSLVSGLMESTCFQKRDGLFKIVHIHADHRPFPASLRDIHMETVGILTEGFKNGAIIKVGWTPIMARMKSGLTNEMACSLVL